MAKIIKAKSSMKVMSNDELVQHFAETNKMRSLIGKPSGADTAGRDAFGCRLSSGTHLCHIALYEEWQADNNSIGLTADEIFERTVELGDKLKIRPRSKSAWGPHFNTLKVQGVVESPARGVYRLTEKGAKQIEAVAKCCEMSDDDGLTALYNKANKPKTAKPKK